MDAESYRPGSKATLLLFDDADDVKIRLFRVDGGHGRLRFRDVMLGHRIGEARSLRLVHEGQRVKIPLRRTLRSGVYFVQLTAAGDRVGYAPFVLSPRKLGERRIAVVLPTQTWQAYNFRDDDGDGVSNTWYASPVPRARLIRPFENRGVPPHFHHYDDPFLRWLDRRGYGVDYLSDAELRETTAAALARSYDLLIFEGHHEYVTEREYDAITGFRDRGGNLMFLSANNFFRRIVVERNLMRRLQWWRKLGRPEAALVGVQSFVGSRTHSSSPWTLRKSAATRWIFRGTGLRPGSRFASGGIEADRLAPASPRGIRVVAEIRSMFGTGKSAQMTFYEAPSGARVFAAGAFTLAGSIWQPPVRRVVANLIDALTPYRPGQSPR